jgi:lysozyme family protein
MDQDTQNASTRSDTRQDESEQGRLALEWGRLKLERQKASIETLLKRRELRAAKPRQWKDLVANPLALAIVGGFITLMTTTITGRISATDSINAEKTKASEALQADLIKKFIDNPDPQKVRANLQFLIDVGLVGDYAGKLQSFLDKHPNNAALPSSATSAISGLQGVHTDDDAIDLVIRLEGRWADDPQDPNGATHFGISVRQLSAYTGQPATTKDLSDLSVDTARDIYRRQYLTGAASGITSVQVKAAYLSLAVTLGPNRAVKYFQLAVGSIDKHPASPTGYLDAETLTRINAVDPDLLIETTICEVAKYQEQLPAFKLYGAGWMKRLRTFSPLSLKGVCPELSADAAIDNTTQQK